MSSLAPRLLTLDEAAGYLSLPLATTRRLGIGRVRLGTKTRYDRVALDAYLDEQRGVTPDEPQPANEAEAALERFTQRYANVARRS